MHTRTQKCNKCSLHCAPGIGPLHGCFLGLHFQWLLVEATGEKGGPMHTGSRGIHWSLTGTRHGLVMCACNCAQLEGCQSTSVMHWTTCCPTGTYSASDKLWRSKQSRYRCLSLGHEYREFWYLLNSSICGEITCMTSHDIISCHMCITWQQLS